MRALIFAILSYATACFGDIATIHSFQEVEKQLQGATKNCLVVFDVDEVLITPTDTVLTAAGSSLCRKMFQGVVQEELDEYSAIAMAHTRYALLDPRSPAVINGLILRKIPTMALTACRTGKCGGVPSMEEWRVDQLKKFGIDFQKSFPGVPDHYFEGESFTGQLLPIFKEGIVFVGGDSHENKNEKGKVLGAFLDWRDFKPEKVFFFDDQMANLISVQDELVKRGIPFQGYLFEDEGIRTLNESVATLQLQILRDQKKWISETEAQEMLLREAI